MVGLLPFIEQEPLADEFDRTKMFSSTRNSNVIGTPISVLVCPSTPSRELVSEYQIVPSEAFGSAGREFQEFSQVMDALDAKYTGSFRGAVTDYSVIARISGVLALEAGYPLETLGSEPLLGMFPYPFDKMQKEEIVATLIPALLGPSEVTLSRGSRTADITDGLSSTLMMVEAAGRPEYWQNGKQSSTPEPLFSAWADPRTILEIGGGTEGCIIQCHNDDEIYSFHPETVNILFADGHVGTAASSVDAKVIVSWMTPDFGD